MNRQKIRTGLHRLGAYVFAQSGVQGLNALTGLLLLRLLAKDEFAIYAVILGVQGTITILTDLGFGAAIQGLVGPRYQDKALLGSYIKAASRIRQLLLLVLTFVALGCLYAFRHTRIPGHSSQDMLWLVGAVLLSTQFQAWASYYEVPLLMNNRLSSYYGPQMGAAVLRILIAILLYKVWHVSAFSMILVSTLSIVIMGMSYRVLSRPYIQVPKHYAKEHVREMVHYLLPLIPGSIYQALQGQISLFLVTVFGHIGQVAEVAAAGRLGQLFLLLNSSNGVLVTPFFAKTPREKFLRRYTTAMAAVCGVAVLVALSVEVAPHAYLLVLGSKYADLVKQVKLVVFAASINYLAGAMWSVAAARKWVFWWSGSSQVVVLLGIQILCVVWLPLNSSVGVLTMSIYTALGALLVQWMHVVQGLRLFYRERRQIQAEAA